jgi:Family of unknown function (DUF6879)
MTTRITEAEFDHLLRTFSRSAFRFETRDAYALDYEQADFDRFLAGAPVPPPEVDWWRPWLDQIRSQANEGKRVSRVRVLAEPPTGYQRWELWAARWHAEAGEQIGYLTRRQAHSLGLPDGDWWLLDDERVIIMGFDEQNRIEAKTLIADPGLIARYLNWRDLAVRNAAAAEEIAAA